MSLQSIVEQHADAYAATHALSAREQRALHCIRHCGTSALGAQLLQCPSGEYQQLQFHACRHRSCPRCAEASRVRWIDAELQRLLPCAHFHVVFTLPHELLALWECNRARLAERLMQAARGTLLELLADPRHLGATPGLLLALHTWGRTLSRHPHVHCLVTAGGMDPEGAWRATRAHWLLPVRVMQHLFRAKLLQPLWALLPHWTLPAGTSVASWRQVLRTLWRAHFNVEVQAPYAHGRGVVLYLARYAKGGPLARKALHLAADGRVQFAYEDHHDGRTRTLSLAPDEFLSRLLWHAPPRGQHTTRHAGLYSTARRAQHARALQQLRPLQPQHREPPPAQPPHTAGPQPTGDKERPAPRCPMCGATLLRTMRLSALELTGWHQDGEIYPSPRQDHIRAPPAPPSRGPTGRSNGQATAATGRAPAPPGIVASARPVAAVACRST